MSEKRCITCGARYMTAHATNCPMYLVNKDAIISEQQARIEELEDELHGAKQACLKMRELLAGDKRIREAAQEALNHLHRHKGHPAHWVLKAALEASDE